MNRRDFIKLSLAALLAACSPKGKGKPIMLQNSTNRYGDMLKDVLSGVSGADQTKVDLLQREMNELWERDNKYRSWLTLQGSDPKFQNLRAYSGDFTTTPVNGAYIGYAKYTGASYPQTLSSSGVATTIDQFPSTIFWPTSIVQWYDQTTGKLEIPPSFSQTDVRMISIYGTVQWGSPSTNGALALYVKKKSDDSTVVAPIIAKDYVSSDAGGFDHPFSANINLSDFTSIAPSDIYFQFSTLLTFAGTRGVAVDALFFKAV